MPIYQRSPRVQEILAYGVEQAEKLRNARANLLKRPLHEWVQFVAFKKENNFHSHLTKRQAKQVKPTPIARFFRTLSPLTAITSRNCELFLASTSYTAIRLIVALTAFFNLAYLAPQTDLSINNNYDLAIYMLDIIVNAVFFLQSVLQILGTPIRCQIDLSMKHITTTGEIIGQSGILALLVTAICFYTGSSTYIGLWFRLLRLIFIVNTIFDYFPQSYILLSGMLKGLQSTSYSLIFLFNLILIYASVGHHLFAENDPYHFSSFSMGLVTFFQVATFDNWTNAYYVNLGGCDSIDTEYTGSGNNSKDPVYTYFGTFYLQRCDSPAASPAAASAIFWSFCFLGSFILVSLSLAAVAIGIMARLEEIKSTDVLEESGGSSSTTGPKRRRSQIELMVRRGEDNDKLNEIKDILDFLWSDRAVRRLSLAERVREDLERAQRKKSWLAKLKIVKKPWFRMSVVVLVYMSAILELLSDLNSLDITYLQIAIQCVLSTEIIVRTLSYWPEPWKFFLGPMRVLDVCGVALIWLPLLLPDIEELRIIQFLYFFRVFVTLREFLYVDTLSSIVTSISESVLPFSYVLLLLMVFYYFFAISGMLLFKVADPYRWGSYGRALNTLLMLMTLDNWSYSMKIGMLGCAHMGYSTGFPNYDGLCAAAGDGRGVGWFAPFHFISYIIMSAMILLSLLVGVLLTTLETVREEQKERRAILKKAAPLYAQYKFSPSQVKELEALFCLLDGEENGCLAFSELSEVFVVLRMTEAEQFSFYLQVDKDNSGQIDFAEFCEMLGRMRQPKVQEREREQERERSAVHVHVTLRRVTDSY